LVLAQDTFLGDSEAGEGANGSLVAVVSLEPEPAGVEGKSVFGQGKDTRRRRRARPLRRMKEDPPDFDAFVARLDGEIGGATDESATATDREWDFEAALLSLELVCNEAAGVLFICEGAPGQIGPDFRFAAKDCELASVTLEQGLDHDMAILQANGPEGLQ
jgi:hypothetical protein